jgi:spore germination protein YaaH
MAYDRHIPPYTKIGEIAPLEWVRKVTQYAMTKCQSNQIRIGLAAYGYDWKNSSIVLEKDFTSGFSESIRIENYLNRREKIDALEKMQVHKFFIWAKNMYKRAY